MRRAPAWWIGVAIGATLGAYALVAVVGSLLLGTSPTIVEVVAEPVADVAGVAVDPAGGVEADPETPAPSETTSPPLTTDAATATTTEPPGPERAVTLAFGGDVHFESFLRAAVLEDPEGLLAPVAPVLSAADLAVVNLETNVGDRGTPEDKEYTFRAPAESLVALEAAGVDVVSLANNHGRDFGMDGLHGTLDELDASGLAVIGAGRDEAGAFGAHEVEIAGRSVAVIGATQVLDGYALESWVAGPERAGLASALDAGIDRLVASVTEAAAANDTVVVFLHWGREREHCPIERQTDLAARLRDAGADIIVGGHAHRLQGGGFLGDAVVHYGLGNFVFYAYEPPATDSGVFTVTIEVDDSLSYEWIPASLVAGVATPLDGEAASAALADWDERRRCTDLTP